DEITSLIKGARSGPKIFIRINDLASSDFLEDLKALAVVQPYGIVLPRCEGTRDVEILALQLARVDCSHSKILPIATETPIGVFNLARYAAVSHYLCGLTWGTEDLPHAIG